MLLALLPPQGMDKTLILYLVLISSSCCSPCEEQCFSTHVDYMSNFPSLDYYFRDRNSNVNIARAKVCCIECDDDTNDNCSITWEKPKRNGSLRYRYPHVVCRVEFKIGDLLELTKVTWKKHERTTGTSNLVNSTKYVYKRSNLYSMNKKKFSVSAINIIRTKVMDIPNQPERSVHVCAVNFKTRKREYTIALKLRQSMLTFRLQYWGDSWKLLARTGAPNSWKNTSTEQGKMHCIESSVYFADRYRDPVTYLEGSMIKKYLQKIKVCCYCDGRCYTMTLNRAVVGYQIVRSPQLSCKVNIEVVLNLPTVELTNFFWKELKGTYNLDNSSSYSYVKDEKGQTNIKNIDISEGKSSAHVCTVNFKTTNSIEYEIVLAVNHSLTGTRIYNITYWADSSWTNVASLQVRKSTSTEQATLTSLPTHTGTKAIWKNGTVLECMQSVVFVLPKNEEIGRTQACCPRHAEGCVLNELSWRTTDDRYIVRNNSPVVLGCKAVGFLKQTITWKKRNGELMKESTDRRRSKGGINTKYATRKVISIPYEAGDYVCTISLNDSVSSISIKHFIAFEPFLDDTHYNWMITYSNTWKSNPTTDQHGKATLLPTNGTNLQANITTRRTGTEAIKLHQEKYQVIVSLLSVLCLVLLGVIVVLVYTQRRCLSKRRELVARCSAGLRNEEKQHGGTVSCPNFDTTDASSSRQHGGCAVSCPDESLYMSLKTNQSSSRQHGGGTVSCPDESFYMSLLKRNLEDS